MPDAVSTSRSVGAPSSASPPAATPVQRAPLTSTPSAPSAPSRPAPSIPSTAAPTRLGVPDVHAPASAAAMPVRRASAAAPLPTPAPMPAPAPTVQRQSDPQGNAFTKATVAFPTPERPMATSAAPATPPPPYTPSGPPPPYTPVSRPTSSPASGAARANGPAPAGEEFDARALSDGQIDELTHRLLGPLTRLLRTELRLDRERIGRLRDPRR
ncbi:extensin [Streptomyces sp. PTM05]|uniref:Extensin n=1 Tax=Streptantibioticus parmotrematis TaxID=2873249 RepID=A0ABS7R4A5_9ACTN|nr:extensin [Streptantibioticus parmotrematis]